MEVCSPISRSRMMGNCARRDTFNHPFCNQARHFSLFFLGAMLDRGNLLVVQTEQTIQLFQLQFLPQFRRDLEAGFLGFIPNISCLTRILEIPDVAELTLKLDDQLATRLSSVAREHYEGDPNVVVSDALCLLFLQPIRKERRRVAKVIDEIRTHAQAAGGITEKEIDQAVAAYRQRNKAVR